MKKILIVDDSISVRKALERILKPKGVEVLSADSAKVALDILEQQHPELIIADIVMPEIDGYEFCGLLKEHERLKTIPVLLISGIVNPEVKSKAKDVKAIGIVKKPFKPDTLLYIVSLIFERLTPEQVPDHEAAQEVVQASTEESTVAGVEENTVIQSGAELDTDQLTMSDTSAEVLSIESQDSQSSGINTEEIDLNQFDSAIEATPIEATPIEATPIETTPIETAQFETAQFEATDFEATPIEATDFEATDFEATPIESTAFETTAANSITQEIENAPISNTSSIQNVMMNTDVPQVSPSLTSGGHSSDVLEAAAQRFLNSVNVGNLWILNNDAQCLLHLGSERKGIETDLGQYFEVLNRTARDFAKMMSYSPMDSLLLEYPETCYLLLEINPELLMVLDLQDISALSMVRYMIRKELPVLVAELEAVPS